MKKGSLPKARFIGEMFATSGVILSLLFVAFQIRQTNAIARVQVNQDLAAALREVNAPLMENQDLAELVAMVLSGATHDDLSPAEQLRVTSFHAGLIRLWESLWLATREEIVDEQVLDYVGSYGHIDSNYFRESWPELRTAHHAGFVEFLEGLEWNR